MEHDDWPSLALSEWEPTYLTLHRWTQIVGKVALSNAPYLNHWWNVALHVNSQGLTVTVPTDNRFVTITFDLNDHRLVVVTSDKRSESFALEPMTVADFYDRLTKTLAKLDVHFHVWPVPVEVTDATPFTDDRHHAAYDPRMVERLHRIYTTVERVFEIHRGRFGGKSSPVHFFWGAFDLAVSRFSGRLNPSPPEGSVMREAYSHEVISHGFWPGGDWLDKARVAEPIFYAYAVPEPQGFPEATVEPAQARYDGVLGEFVLPYDVVRTAPEPEQMLLGFMESTYLAAAERAGWDVEALRAPVLIEKKVERRAADTEQPVSRA